MPKIILPHLALFCANSIYAINYIFAKDVMPHYLGPSGFILLRVLGACLVFSLIHHFFIKETIQKKVIEALKDYTEIHKNAFTHKMTSVRGKLLSDSHVKQL